MKYMGRILICVLILLPSRLWAASFSPPDLWLSGLKLLVGMLLVIGIILFMYALNRRGFAFFKSSRPNRIQILETRPVGGRKALCLVRVRGEDLLLGLGNDRVDLLLHFGASQGGDRFEDELQERLEAGR